MAQTSEAAISPPPAPTVSICIANYNGMAVIDDCVQSVLAQEGGIAIEILVHDDASSDGSDRHVAERYPQVRLLRSEHNVGFCVANNRMVAAARGEFILLLNNDAALFPDAVRALLQAARQIGMPAILGLPQYDAADGHLIDIGSTFDPFLNPMPNLARDRGDIGMIIGACFWLPRALWQELGGFPEWFGSMAEDMYLCCVARLWGHLVRVVGASGFRHWVGASFGGGRVAGQRLATTYKRRVLSERNKTYVMLLTYPAVLLCWFPLHLLLLVLEGALLSLAKLDTQPWRRIYGPCLRSLWQERARLRTLRRAVQAKRRIGSRAFFAPHGWLPHKLRMLLRHGLPSVR